MYDEAVRFGTGVAWLALCVPAFGQVSEASLEARYGKPVAGSYVVRPGVTIKTYEGPKGEVCVLTISGPKTEKDLMAIVDQAVPSASRGLALGGVSVCAGICPTIRNYEKLTIETIVLYDGDRANATAAVTSKSKNCEARVKEVPRFAQDLYRR